MVFDTENDRIIRSGGSLVSTPSWVALVEHHRRVADLEMRDLFAADPGRFE